MTYIVQIGPSVKKL